MRAAPAIGPNGRAVLYWVIKAILTPILRGFYRVRIEGREHVPGARAR